MDVIKPIRFDEIPKIDSWVPDKEDTIITNIRHFVIMPVSKILNVESQNLDLFIMRPKKCYNSQVVRDQICHVLNYFERYFDEDKELLVYIARMKYMIDNYPQYNKQTFLNDIKNYVLGPNIKRKVQKLVEYNYSLDLAYKSISAPLQYNNTHAKILLAIGILMNFVISLTTHFASVNRESEIDEWILDVYDIIFSMFPEVNIFGKLFETAYSNVSKSEYKNQPLWDMQDIRRKDSVTHSRDSVDNIILNIMCKYEFNRNIISLNYTSINKNTSCQITDIGYEFDFISLSSSKRDADSDGANSEYDRHTCRPVW